MLFASQCVVLIHYELDQRYRPHQHAVEACSTITSETVRHTFQLIPGSRFSRPFRAANGLLVAAGVLLSASSALPPV